MGRAQPFQEAGQEEKQVLRFEVSGCRSRAGTGTPKQGKIHGSVWVEDLYIHIYICIYIYIYMWLGLLRPRAVSRVPEAEFWVLASAWKPRHCRIMAFYRSWELFCLLSGFR